MTLLGLIFRQSFNVSLQVFGVAEKNPFIFIDEVCAFPSQTPPKTSL